MRALEFSRHLQEAGLTLASIGASEPAVVVREGRDGDELPIAKVKVRRDIRGQAFIILEF